MLGSFDEAEDHVQEVFLRAWRSRDCFEGRSSPRTWLHRVATNACLDTLRRDARRAGRQDWAPAAEPDSGQRCLLQRYIAAHEQADPEALIEMLREDVRLAISPQVGEWNGRPDVGDALRGGMNSLGRWRLLPITANGQPGAAGYVRRPGETAFLPFVLAVLRFEHGRLADIAAFEQPSMFSAFGLPARQ